MEFYSHKDTFLKDHLKKVAIRSKNYFYFKNGGDDLKILSYYIGLSHDFGKYTSFFQNKLKDSNYSTKYFCHSLTSSIFSYFLVQRKLEYLNFEFEIKEFLPLISFFVVKHHHTDLKSLEYLDSILDDDIDKVKNQIDDIFGNSKYINLELEELGLEIKIEDFHSEYSKVIENIKRDIFYFNMIEDSALNRKLAFLLLTFFSSLIDADKKSAGKLDDIERVDIPSNIVDIYKKEKFKNINNNQLNLLREEIYNKVIGKVEKIDLNKKIYTLTSPTGSGKTLTSFSFAIKLRNRIKKELGYTPRIIYSLPFISIINQNFDVFNEVLSMLEDYKKSRSKYLLAHHHLSESKYEEDNEYLETEKSILLIEAWESEIIVTTFVQLLETIIGFKNKFLKKYHNIAKSIILLDEVQNIPVEYWNIVGNMLFYLSKYFDCHIILLTSTKPLIFKDYETIELLDDNEKYYKCNNRVRLIPNFKIKTLDDTLDFFSDIHNENPNNSYMFVLNTINSSIEFYIKLKELIDKRNLYYLSSNVIPKHRIERIKEMKERLKKREKIYLVTTQVVEAGVDIDFDIVFRDIAPLDSVIQVAGRCNRENRNNVGDVYILSLFNEKNSSYSKMVYGKVSPDLAYQIISKKDSIPENSFYELINHYFEEISKLKSQQDSIDIEMAFLNWRFSESGKYNKTVSDFKMINDINTLPVFIEIDQNAKELWLEFNRIYNSDLKLWEKNLRFLEIKNEFEMYVVSPRLRSEPLKILNSKNLGYVCNDQIDKYYNIETGFIKVEELELFY